MTRRRDIVLAKVPLGGGEREHTAAGEDLLRHALVCGPTGCGKSMLLSSIILQVLCRRPDIAVVLIDPKGETHDFLVRVALPALADRYPHLRPERLVVIDPFAAHVVGLDPLVRAAGVEPAQQAWNLTTLLMSLFDTMGDRMRSVAVSVIASVIHLGGTLLDVVRCLTQPEYAVAVGAGQTDPLLRDYMMRTLHGGGEPSASVHSVRSRLEYLLGSTELRTQLTCGRSVTGRELLAGPFTSISTGRPPLGDVRLARFFAQLLFLRVTGGIFERSEADARRPVLVVVDEFPEVVRADGGQTVERILSLARSRGCFIWAACQSLSQVAEVSPALVRSLVTNIGYDIRFRPDPSDVRHLDALLPVTGRRVDPERPDRLLTEPEERRALLSMLTRLPPRSFLLADRRAGTAIVARTPTVPVTTLKERASALSPAVLQAFLTGKFGVPRGELTPKGPIVVSTERPTRRFTPEDILPSVAPESAAAAEGQDSDNVVTLRGTRARRVPPRRARPVLELP